MKLTSYKTITSKTEASKTTKGFLSLSGLIFVLFSLIIGYSCVKIIPFYYSYYELNNLLQAQADVATERKDSDILDIISRTIKKLDIPAEPKDIKINRTDRRVIIQLSYSEVFYVDFGSGYDYDIWEFDFNAKGEASL